MRNELVVNNGDNNYGIYKDYFQRDKKRLILMKWTLI